MGAAERRAELLRVLCRRRHDTVENLASEFGVSERTIRRDIEALSVTAPIYTKSGRYVGGVYIMEGYTMDRAYMSEEQLNVLKKLLSTTKKDGLLSLYEEKILRSIIKNYSMPKIEK